jgi:hypothetical protein
MHEVKLIELAKQLKGPVATYEENDGQPFIIFKPLSEEELQKVAESFTRLVERAYSNDKETND